MALVLTPIAIALAAEALEVTVICWTPSGPAIRMTVLVPGELAAPLAPAAPILRVAWLAACQLDVSAASCYYGGGIINTVDAKPGCATIMHFGNLDASIPMDEVTTIANAQPDVSVYVYDADHGFHCDQSGQFNPRATNIAAMRTARLFDANLRG